MRVAFIGAGKMASDLMACVDDVDGAEITAVCDVDESAAVAAADPRGAAVFTDHETLFADHDFDAVFLAIPPFAYGNQAELAVEHGVDLFVEKPVGLRPEDAREVEEQLRDADVVTGSGYVFRYDRITERTLDLVGDRDIGLLHARYWSGLPNSEWGYEMARSGSDVNIRTTHVLDTMRYLAGDVDRVYATDTDRIGTDEVDYADGVAATVEHQSGVVGTVSSSITAPEWTVEIDVAGEDFQLSLDYAAQSLTGTVGGQEIDFDGTCDRYRREVAEFIEACERGDQSHVRSSFSDATRTLELNWAVIESAERAEPLELS
ncbi:Gfo/Idh/MocA family protein [Halomicrococcus sp. SG-WS-1]|uniref:Gfo/Idh/MocA family protein n=1 Tax=Halomicrococcus sp. SG-WS-1 TaxID=3439057 RepID=UPI003F7AC189